jgi:hypothetical protein
MVSLIRDTQAKTAETVGALLLLTVSPALVLVPPISW